MDMKLASILRILLAATLVLLVPLIAMQLTDEVDWNLTDFLVAGMLLLAAGSLFEHFTNKIDGGRYRIFIGVVILVVFVLVWAELGVGIFGTPWAGS